MRNRHTLGLVAALAIACQTTDLPIVRPSPSPEASAVALGGVLRVDIATEPGSLDPLAASDPDTQLVMHQVYEGLVGLAPGAFSIVPVLATGWSVSADARTWTCTLRDGVRFHDGTALDADAAAASLRRLPEHLGRGVDPSAVRAHVEVTATRTLAITTDRPYGALLALLALPSSAIASAADRTAGTGPLAFAPSGWPRGSDHTVRANTTYWQRDPAGRPLPYLDGFSAPSLSDRVDWRTAFNFHGLGGNLPDGERVRGNHDPEPVGGRERDAHGHGEALDTLHEKAGRRPQDPVLAGADDSQPAPVDRHQGRRPVAPRARALAAYSAPRSRPKLTGSQARLGDSSDNRIRPSPVIGRSGSLMILGAPYRAHP